MSEKVITAQQMMDWCDKMAASGQNPVLKWEGGNDSGWCHMEDENGVSIESPEAEALIDYMYDTLDYGSWAGDFNASGEAPYDKETKCFEGVDSCGTSEEYTCEAAIRIEIPAYVMFDRLEIETSDETCHVSCDVAVFNGFVHPETKAIMDKLAMYLREEISLAADEATKGSLQEFDSFWHHYVIDRNDFKREGDMMVYTLKQVHYSLYDNEDKGVCINLLELIENERDI